MDADRFDDFVRAIPVVTSRRTAVGGVLGASLAALLAASGAGDIVARKKRRRKKKKKCTGGKKKCGKKCCAPGTCFDGACCPAARACGTVCCPEGQICGDPATAACVAGQGTCPTGADSCDSVDFIFCNGGIECICAQATDGTTRCATPIDGITTDDCGDCATDADCEQQFPDVVGVFCAENATGPCGCPEGANLCSAPCSIV